jgi:hypothetical protein
VRCLTDFHEAHPSECRLIFDQLDACFQLQESKPKRPGLCARSHD